MRKSKFVRIASKLLLIIIGIVFACGLAEFGARLLGPPYGLDKDIFRIHQCDQTLGWRGVAQGALMLDWHGYEHPFVLNSQGMHDNEHTWEKDDDVFRILMIGDSMLAATEVAEAETSHQILENILNQKSDDMRFEVINGAIFAWGPPQALMYFRTEGKNYNPDLVLVSWFPGNDLSDVLPYHVMTMGPEGGVHCFAPYFALCDEQFDPRPWFVAPGISQDWQKCTPQRRMITRTLNYIYYHSRLYQRLTAGLLQVYEKETFSLNLYSPWLDFTQEDTRLNEAYQLTIGIYGQLANEADKIGAKTAFFISPVNEAIDVDVNPDRRAAMIAREPILDQADPTLPNKTFITMMTEQNIPVVDLHPYFVAHIQSTGESLHWSANNSHWNIAGNRVAGETLATWLIEQKLVPIENN
ncbi:MAG: hypothetical protein KDJ52_12935 [Anaerolineae bacterium]|nr:hypothetical protein [Anaerolineae bacterium]